MIEHGESGVTIAVFSKCNDKYSYCYLDCDCNYNSSDLSFQNNVFPLHKLINKKTLKKVIL